MTNSSQNIAALLGSRICHDLVSPIGAISNGVELLQMSGSSTGPEMDLISESVENASARIRFFRVAFGIASLDQHLGIGEVKEILDGLTKGTRLKIDWQSDQNIARAEAKQAFLMIQCLEAAMPWGGRITVSQIETRWGIAGLSDRLKDVSHLWTALQDPNGMHDVTAAEVQFLLLPLLLTEQGRSLDLSVSDVGITARF